jgi:low temperature requirement protein LtrA
MPGEGADSVTDRRASPWAAAAPSSESGGVASPPVSWIELFYDLVMVAAVVVFSDSLVQDGRWENIVWLTIMFGLVWWVWMATTLAINLDRREDQVLAGLIVGQMFGVTMLTIVAGNSVDTRSDAVAGIYMFLMLLVAAVHELAARREPRVAAFCRRRRNLFALSAVLWGLGGLMPDPIHGVVWIVAGLVMLSPLLTSRVDVGDRPPRGDDHHLRERVALLTIIVFGESFVKVSLTASHTDLASVDFVVLGLQFVVLFAAFDAYFTDVPKTELPRSPGRRRAWLAVHFALHMAIIGLAVGLATFVVQKPGAALTEGDVRSFVGSLVLIFVSLAGLDALSSRPDKRRLVVLRLATAAVFGLLGAFAIWLAPELQIGALIYGVAAILVVVVSHATLGIRGRTEPLTAISPDE